MATQYNTVPKTRVPTRLKPSATPVTRSTRNTAAVTAQLPSRVQSGAHFGSLPAVSELVIGRMIVSLLFMSLISWLPRMPCGC